MDTRYIFPQGVLVTVTFIGDVIGIVGSKTCAECVPWLLLPYQGQGLLLVAIEVLRFGFDQALFLLNACPASKEGNVEAVEIYELTEV